MRPIEAVQFEQRIEDLFDKVNTLPDDPEILAHWARYICILVSGYIEVSMAAICRVYVKDKADARTRDYVSTNVERFTNPKMEKILQLVGAFDQSWRAEIKEYVDGSPKDAVDSVVANRNLIAHGKNVGISIVRVKEYYTEAKSVIAFVESVLIQE